MFMSCFKKPNSQKTQANMNIILSYVSDSYKKNWQKIRANLNKIINNVYDACFPNPNPK